MPSSLAAELKIMAGKRVYPNFSRAPQPLESYALEALNMKGSMRNNRGQILALIQTPDQQIERVQVGNYMGMNQAVLPILVQPRLIWLKSYQMVEKVMSKDQEHWS